MKPKLISNAQIYLDCRKLLDFLLDVTPNFPRAYKYGIGARMHEIGINLISLISSAYMNRELSARIGYLTKFQAEFEVMKTLIRLAGERKWIIGRGKHAEAIELLNAIGKQSSAWKNSLIKATSRNDNE